MTTSTPKHTAPQLSALRRASRVIALAAACALCWAAVPDVPTATTGGVRHATAASAIKGVDANLHGGTSWLPGHRHL